MMNEQAIPPGPLPRSTNCATMYPNQTPSPAVQMDTHSAMLQDATWFPDSRATHHVTT